MKKGCELGNRIPDSRRRIRIKEAKNWSIKKLVSEEALTLMKQELAPEEITQSNNWFHKEQ